MSNKAKRVFTVTGTTKPLVDGQTREVTLAGVVQHETVYHEQRIIGKLRYPIFGPDYEVVEKNLNTLSIGLSVVAPMDVATKKEGLSATIAEGKALKVKTRIAYLRSDEPFFDKGIVLSILEKQLARILRKPDDYIKVSKPKTTPVAEASGN